MPAVVIIGAGVAGLTAARRLVDEETANVVVLDKGRSVGGRLATRRIGDATFDHGAQFLTTHSSSFAETVTRWLGAGVVTDWYDGRVGPVGVVDPDGHTRYRGVATMNAIAKHLATGLDVRTGTAVTAVRLLDGAWQVEIGDGEPLRCDAVLMTAPVPQSLALLDAGSVVVGVEDRAALEAIRYDPCIAVLAPLDSPSAIVEPGAVAPTDGVIDWMADNQIKGVSAAPAVTIHASATFSEDHRDAPAGEVAATLLEAAGLAGVADLAATQVHRWRYARPTVMHHERCLAADQPVSLVFAGDAFGGPQVEGAALSGDAAVVALMAMLDPVG